MSNETIMTEFARVLDERNLAQERVRELEQQLVTAKADLAEARDHLAKGTLLAVLREASTFAEEDAHGVRLAVADAAEKLGVTL